MTDLCFESYNPVNSRIFNFNGKRYLYRELENADGNTKVFGQVPDSFTLVDLKNEDDKLCSKLSLQEKYRQRFMPEKSNVHRTFIDPPSYGAIGKPKLLGMQSGYITKNNSYQTSYVGISKKGDFLSAKPRIKCRYITEAGEEFFVGISPNIKLADAVETISPNKTIKRLLKRFLNVEKKIPFKIPNLIR